MEGVWTVRKGGLGREGRDLGREGRGLSPERRGLDREGRGLGREGRGLGRQPVPWEDQQAGVGREAMQVVQVVFTNCSTLGHQAVRVNTARSLLLHSVNKVPELPSASPFYMNELRGAAKTMSTWVANRYYAGQIKLAKLHAIL